MKCKPGPLKFDETPDSVHTKVHIQTFESCITKLHPVFLGIKLATEDPSILPSLQCNRLV